MVFLWDDGQMEQIPFNKIGIGVSIGVAIGAVLDNIALGIGVGISIGVGLILTQIEEE